MRGLIALAGDLIDSPWLHFELDQGKDYVVAADGGMNHLQKLGIKADYLLGDMDSIDPNNLDWVKKQDIPIKYYTPEKDSTDGEMAIDQAIQVGSKDLLIIGALSSERIDHVMGTVLVARQYVQRGIPICLTDGRCFWYLLKGPLHFKREWESIQKPSVVSCLTPDEKLSGLSSQGLVYPLDEVILKSSSARGVSNTVSDLGYIDIKLETDGELWVQIIL